MLSKGIDAECGKAAACRVVSDPRGLPVYLPRSLEERGEPERRATGFLVFAVANELLKNPILFHTFSSVLPFSHPHVSELHFYTAIGARCFESTVKVPPRACPREFSKLPEFTKSYEFGVETTTLSPPSALPSPPVLRCFE